MIIESNVNMEQASKLKEKGFDCQCASGFQTEDNDIVFDKSPKNWNEYKDTVSMPTYQMVLRWFRENHKIHIQLEPYWCSDGMQWLAKIMKIEKYNTVIIKTVMVNDTHEDATSRAIDYVLDNLI